MKLSLSDDPVYGLAVNEAARVNRVGGLRFGEKRVDVSVLCIAIEKMADEIEDLRARHVRPRARGRKGLI